MKEIVRVKELDQKERIGNFDEVVQGYTEDQAIEEASRCLQCNNPVCIEGCPVGIDIKKFIGQIQNKDYKGAYLTIREKNKFPSICGRVCPAEYQCRKSCVLTKKGEPFASERAINIHFLERFIGDYGARENIDSNSKGNRLSKYNVAVVGSGPAGICCAGELAREGIGVVIYETLHKMGGVLQYGIPPFRLPREILNDEINSLKSMGIEFRPNYIIGKIKTLDELFNEGFDAIFLGLGAGTPSFLGIEGENLCNVYSANEFLTRVNLMNAYKFPEFHTPINVGRNMIVIGGGNVAIDSARVALRLQKLNNIEPNTTIAYRRTEIEMPARRLEIEHAKEEGIKFEFLVQPVELIGNENGYVEKIKAIKCELGEPDQSGRRRPNPIEGSEFELDCDVAVIAVGLSANQVLTSLTPELEVGRYRDVIVNGETMETSIPHVYAGGDIVGGEGTVIEAMGMAKKATRSIVEYLSNR